MMNGASQPKGLPAGVPVRRSAAPAMGSPPGAPGRKRVVMRLKCRNRPLIATYFQNGQISGMDSDVTFNCSDGGVVRAHKIILASSSKFFTDLFADQKAGKMTTVSVPDVRSDVMKLVLLITYKEQVVVTSEQLDKLKEATEIFGLQWERFKRESSANDFKLDVKPGKIMESPQMPPPPLMAKPLQPTRAQLPHSQHRVGPSMINMRMQQQRQSSEGMRYGGKPQTSVRTGSFPNSRKDVGGEEEEDSDGSEESSFTFQLQGYEPSEQNQERRKSKLTPRVETETDDLDETDVNSDPVECKRMMDEWVSKVGKNEPELKRRRVDSGNGGREQSTQYECTVCKAEFVKERAWRWHEERHVGLGLFKCSRCDKLLKTGRTVWLHEQSDHAFCAIAVTDLEESTQIPNNFQLIEARGKQGIMYRNSYGQTNQKSPQLVGNRGLSGAKLTQMRRLNASKMVAAKKKAPVSKQGQAPKSPAIGIGNSIGSEHLDSKKIKQLHWLYVCGSCENCSDSATKAVAHYRKCYPSQAVPFEATVTKYRQGFYGKSMCPLCPRRYAANGGFMIHCGHQHTEYRRLFSHTGAAEDKLRCVNCQRKFNFPEEFHDHLDDGQECHRDPINEESMPLLSSSRSSGGGTPTDRNKRKTLVSARTAVEEIPTAAVIPPRSARLAQRASLAAQRALESGAKAVEESKGKKSVIRRESVLDYPPADCPICGATEVANISQHLTSDHQDLDVTVNRISPDLLRCRKCLITFAICDLLAHTNTCTGPDKVVQQIQQRRCSEVEPTTATATAAESSKPKVDIKAPKEVIAEELPPGVGSSPIDRIENVDLFNKETLRKAMECGVCGKISTKLGDIAVCLRSHGVHRCALCFNSYANKSDYPQHLKKCHGSAAASNKLKCPLCNKVFMNAGQVAGHMYSSHWLSLLSEMKQDFKINGGFLKPTDAVDETSAVEVVGDEQKEVDALDKDDSHSSIENISKDDNNDSIDTLEEIKSDEDVVIRQIVETDKDFEKSEDLDKTHELHKEDEIPLD